MHEITYPEPSDLASQLKFRSGDGKIWLGEQRIILFSLVALGKFRKEVIDTIGWERAKGFFIRLGYEMGIQDSQLAQNLRLGSDPKDIFLAGPQLHALRGMVKVEPVELELDLETGHFYSVIDWIDSYEVDICLNGLGGIQPEPICWNLLGYACAYTSIFMKREVFFQEVECKGAGDKRCRIIGKPAEDWDNYHEFKRYFEASYMMEELQKLQSQVNALRDNIEDENTLADVVGRSKSFRNAINMVSKASDSKVSVLLLGETGVGKEVLAHTLHKFSERSNEPFVAINCAAIPPDLIESELFGVEKGAFTGATQSRMGRFERAHKGTIFLDEVIELTPRAQASLLRVLQENELERVGDNRIRKVDVRVVAATNEDLELAVKEGRFRADLFYRLSAYPVVIPPLRERSEDIPLFAEYFLEKYQALYNKKTLGISDRGMEMLLNYKWPGNIREMENVIERGLILAEPYTTIGAEHLFPNAPNQLADEQVVDAEGNLALSCGDKPANVSELAKTLLTQGVNLENLEATLIKEAIAQANGNISKAARLLGMTRPAFSYRLKKIKGR